jgi:NADPH:quinone reductase-like Zn-dependent oxidoreductase
MKAARIHNFGGPQVIVVEDVLVPVPASGEVLLRVAATGVGPWDALIREGKSKVAPQPPLTLGSDLSGVVEAVGRRPSPSSRMVMKSTESPTLNSVEQTQSMRLLWQR